MILPEGVSSFFSQIDNTWKLRCISATVLTSTFYALQIISQTALKGMRFHGGLAPLITLPIGFAVTANSMLASQCIETEIRRCTNDYGIHGRLPRQLPSMRSIMNNLKKNLADKEILGKLIIGMGVFMLIEQGLFRTTFPSSVITPGVFSNFHQRSIASVLATSDVATQSQRLKIQQLGKIYGCHHCGSRQLLSQKVFIADHMPPTKMTKMMEARWWRRLLKIKVSFFPASHSSRLWLVVVVGTTAIMATVYQLFHLTRNGSSDRETFADQSLCMEELLSRPSPSHVAVYTTRHPTTHE